jgi:serine protease Do
VSSAVLIALALCGSPSRDAHPVPPAVENVIQRAIDRALPAVVKLYGASIGTAHGYGTGVLVSADGLILTVDSILLDASNLRAVLGDGRRFRAEVVRRDPVRELALLKIDANRLPFLVPEPSDSLRPGDGVVVAGNCFKIAEGEEPVTFMHGVLSVRAALELRRRAQPLEYAGQLLVLDTHGRFVGLVGPTADAAETNTRLNYALPSEELVPFLAGERTTPAEAVDSAPRELSRAGRPYVGVRLFKLGYQKKAAFIDRIVPGSPAADAGLKSDDLIIAVDDRRVATTDDFERILAELRPGQRVRITYKRGDVVEHAELTVAEAPK